MWSTALIFVWMTSCVCSAVGSCVLKHENGSRTLQWNFSPEIALRPLDISCDQNTFGEFLHQTNSGEDTSYQSQYFRGRVQADVSALRDGVLRVHISHPLQEDSGLYSCTFYSSNGRSTSHCRLPVSGGAKHEVWALFIFSTVMVGFIISGSVL